MLFGKEAVPLGCEFDLLIKKVFISGDCHSAAIQIVNQVREEMKPREVRDFPRRSWEGKSQSFVSCFLVPHEILPVTEKFPVETCGCVAIH